MVAKFEPEFKASLVDSKTLPLWFGGITPQVRQELSRWLVALSQDASYEALPIASRRVLSEFLSDENVLLALVSAGFRTISEEIWPFKVLTTETLDRDRYRPKPKAWVVKSPIIIDGETKYLDLGRINFSRNCFYMYDLTSLSIVEHEEKASSFVNAIVNMTGWRQTRVWMRYLDSKVAYKVLGGLFRIPKLQQIRWALTAKECLPEIYKDLISYIHAHPDRTEEEIKSSFENLSDEIFKQKFDELVGAGYIQIALAGNQFRYYVPN